MIQVHSEGRAHFDAAVKMAFSNAPGVKASHYLRGGIPKRKHSDCNNGKRTYWEGADRRTQVEVTCGKCKDGWLGEVGAMVLYWNEDKREGFDIQPLPFPMAVEAATEFLWAYLQSAKYPEQPDHDGSNSKGFEVSTGNFWGHVEGSHYSILMVAPEWQMYGK